MGQESCGMLLSAERGEKLHLIMLDDAVPAGSRLVYLAVSPAVSLCRGGYQPPVFPGSIRRDGGFWRRAVREAGPYGVRALMRAADSRPCGSVNSE